MTVPDGFLKSVSAFVKAQGAKGDRSLGYAGGHTHNGEFGKWSGGFGEKLIFRAGLPAFEVCALYCDDGDTARKTRAQLTNAAFKCIAVDFAEH
jgi:hypothetical protein